MINYIFFIITGLLIFLTFRVLRLIDYRIKRLRKYYPLFVTIELGLWIFYIFWIVSHFLYSKSYYNELVLVLVIAVVGLLVWYYIKDIVSGFIFKIKHNPRVGQELNSIESRGIIKKLSASQIFVEVEGKDTVRIPYSQLLNKSINLNNVDIHSASEVVLHFVGVKQDDPIQLEKKIRGALLQSPWSVPNKPIRIEFILGEKSGIEISLHLVDRSFGELARTKLKGILES
ncbi:MAG TPA: mechanosensitive ion channel [Cyclobacteriaceae bacterium]|nr:mechanosensitive ion channel [Cyclobacteriaceae bacterium]